MLKPILLILVLTATVSCGTSKIKLSSGGEKVEVLKRKPERGDCSVIGKVTGVNEDGSVDLAENHARNLVASKGGNAITFDEEVNNGKSFQIHSTGYKCK